VGGLTDIKMDMTTKTEGEAEIIDRLARLERAVLLLAKHVGATGWNKPLQDVLDDIWRLGSPDGKLG